MINNTTWRKKAPKKQRHPFPMSDLPRDVLINILCVLPAVTLLQCKQVCKQWRYIILRDTLFAKIHYNNHVMSRPGLLYHGRLGCLDDTDTIYFVEGYRTGKQGWKKKLIEFGRSVYFSFLDLNTIDTVNSCRGFVLLTSFNDLFVYKPLTNENWKIPLVEQRAYLGVFNVVGLGFGHVSNQYKVVIFESKNCYLHVHTVAMDDGCRRVEMNCEVVIVNDDVLNKNQALALNGCLHWIATLDMISCFNVDHEELGIITSPCFGDERKKIANIGLVHGLLYVNINEKHRFGIDLWVMREYDMVESWIRYVVLTEDHRIRNNSFWFDYGCQTLVNVIDEEEIVILSDCPASKLIVYNLKEGCFSRLPIKFHTVETINYNPSFFSIRNQMQVEG